MKEGTEAKGKSQASKRDLGKRDKYLGKKQTEKEKTREGGEEKKQIWVDF